jgi:hypothetical protein
MDKGCDIWLTDLSTVGYDPRVLTPPARPPELWHYYCHLPINVQFRAPLTLAPNMEIDNPALEHRLALWMSWRLGAKGVVIWSGNSEWSSLGSNFWERLDLSGDAYRNAYTFPYAGVHHGNGLLVYPPRTPGGDALPSLRLKVLRDAMEDLAILEAASRRLGRKGKALCDPVPDVFQHPQYFDRLPETLLEKRAAILRRVGGR